MKKVILLLMLLLCFIPLVACEKEQDKTNDLVFYYHVRSDDYSVSINPDVRWTVESVTIPATYKDKPVTAIDDFNDAHKLVSVTLPHGITHISFNAFSGCTSLSRINLPSTLTSLDADSFRGCNALFEIENGASYVDGWLLRCDKKITDLAVREGTVGIASKALGGCAIRELTIPASLTRINGLGACSSLSHITVAKDNPVYHSDGNCLIETTTNTLVRGSNTSEIPAYIKIIGYDAFKGSALQELTLPLGITAIGAEAFAGCSNLTSITLPDTLTSIGNGAFSSCVKLTEVTLPKGIATISDYAFASCTALTTVILPDSVTAIEDHSFIRCTVLRTLVVPAGVKYILYSNHLSDCQDLTIYYGGTKLLFGSTEGYEKIRYYKEQKPTEDHSNYWHYVDGVPTVWQEND